MKNTLYLICASTLVSICGFAGVQPLAVTLMERQGLGPAQIGLLSALIFGGVLVLAPFQPALTARYGVMRTYQAGKTLVVLGFAGCAWAHSAGGWAAAFLLLGLGGALTWPLTDTLLAEQAPPDRKGAWLGLFQAGMGLAFALGPLVSAGLARHPREVFLGAAALAGLSSLPLWGQRCTIPAAGTDDEAGYREVWMSAAGFVGVAFLGGLFENGTHTVGVLVALGLDWPGAAAVALPGVMAFGSFAVQYPLGRTADRYGTREVLLGGLAVLALSMAVLPLVAQWHPLLWFIALAWGVAGGCLYTLAMTGSAQRFSARQVAAATTLVVLGYTLGSAAGPVIGGFALDAASLRGVAWAFGAMALLGGAFAYRKKPGLRPA